MVLEKEEKHKDGITELEPNGHLLIKDVAGSGKTLEERK